MSLGEPERISSEENVKRRPAMSNVGTAHGPSVHVIKSGKVMIIGLMQKGLFRLKELNPACDEMLCTNTRSESGLRFS